MDLRKPATERLGAFSDGVIAIIITIMVLELKTPPHANWGALLELWPTFLSYALSYLFVGIFWMNHHQLLHHTQWAEPMVMRANLLVLFFVSLVPFFTRYMAESDLGSFTTALYAGIFLLVTLAFILFQRVIAKQFGLSAELRAMDRAARRRNWTALIAYTLAIPAAYLHPAISLVMIGGVAVLYFVPDALKRTISRHD